MKKAVFISLPLMFMLTACPFYGYKHNTGHFPEGVRNLEVLNSEYDDFNSTAPFIIHHQLFHFSSNRRSQGGEFDIVGEDLVLEWDKVEGGLTVHQDPHLEYDPFHYLHPMMDSVNTPANEFGPYSIGYLKDVADATNPWVDLMLFSSDSGGDFDIFFIGAELRDYGYSHEEALLGSVYAAEFLNTGANELYPCFAGPSFYLGDAWLLDPVNIENIMWCNDKEGDYDIVQVSFSAGDSLLGALQDQTPAEPDKVQGINSDAEDKCPYANGELLVFASDREGGYGGFDLYYCIWTGEAWGDPVNFGKEINTSADEYRPISLHHSEFDNNLLIFSSNREGGMGGFDLYYTGIDQMVMP